MKASELFKKRPEKWGLRGDPYFWDHLEKIFEKYECPVRSEDIEEIIKTEYMAVSGEELTRGSMPFISEYSSGGMSSGKLCGEFWLDKAIPLIKKRNDDLYKEESQKVNDRSRIGDICFICNTAVLILLMVVGSVIMHISGLELSASIIINVLLFFLYGFLEERCLSKYVNISVKWLYNRIVVSGRH